jgi:hypothetical protein
MPKPSVPFVFVPDSASTTPEYESRFTGRAAPRSSATGPRAGSPAPRSNAQRRSVQRRRWLPWIFRAPALPWIMQPRILPDAPDPLPPPAAAVAEPPDADPPEPDGP